MSRTASPRQGGETGLSSSPALVGNSRENSGVFRRSSRDGQLPPPTAGAVFMLLRLLRLAMATATDGGFPVHPATDCALVAVGYHFAAVPCISSDRAPTPDVVSLHGFLAAGELPYSFPTGIMWTGQKASGRWRVHRPLRPAPLLVWSNLMLAPVRPVPVLARTGGSWNRVATPVLGL